MAASDTGATGRSLLSITGRVFARLLTYRIAAGLVALAVLATAVDWIARTGSERIRAAAAAAEARGLAHAMAEDLTSLARLAADPRFAVLTARAPTWEESGHRVEFFDGDHRRLRPGADPALLAAGEALARRLAADPDVTELAAPWRAGAAFLYARRVTPAGEKPLIIVQRRAAPAGALDEGVVIAPTAEVAPGAPGGAMILPGGLTIAASAPAPATDGAGRYGPALGLLVGFFLLAGVRAAGRADGDAVAVPPSTAADRADLRPRALAAERSSDVVLALDESQSIIWANDALVTLTGRRPDDVKGWPFADILAAMDVPAQAVAALSAPNGGDVAVEAALLGPGGETIHSEIRITRAPAAPDGTSPGGYFAYLRDVSAAHRTIRRLSETVEALPAPLIVVDADERIVLSNDAHRRLLRSLGVGPMDGALFPAFLNALAGAADRGAETPEVWAARRLSAWRAEADHEARLSSSDGRSLLTRTIATASGDRVSTSFDLTPQRRAEAAASAAATAREAALARITDEVRSPLVNLLTLTELALEGETDEGRRAGLKAIRKAGDGALSAIDDMVDGARAAAGVLELREERFDLFETVQDVATLITPSAAAQGLDCVLRFDPKTPRHVIGDASRTRRILAALAAAATEASAPGALVLRADCAQRGDDARAAAAGMRTKLPVFRLSIQTTPRDAAKAQLRTGRAQDGLGECRALAKAIGADLTTGETGGGVAHTLTMALEIDAEATPSPSPLAGLRVALFISRPADETFRDMLELQGAVIAAPDDADLNVVALSNADPVGLADRPTICIAPLFGRPDMSAMRRRALRAHLVRRPVRLASLDAAVAAVLAPGDTTAGALDEGGRERAGDAAPFAGLPVAEASVTGGAYAPPVRVLCFGEDADFADDIAAMLSGAACELNRAVTEEDAFAAIVDRPDAILVTARRRSEALTGFVRRLLDAGPRRWSKSVRVVGVFHEPGGLNDPACTAAGLTNVFDAPVSADRLSAALSAPVDRSMRRIQRSAMRRRRAAGA